MKVSGKFDRDAKTTDDLKSSKTSPGSSPKTTPKTPPKTLKKTSMNPSCREVPAVRKARVNSRANRGAKGASKKLSSHAPAPVIASSAPAEAPVQEWIELFPAGVSVATAMGRPVLILKDPMSGDVLPVWMQPLDAGVAMAELSHTMGATPHAVTRQLLALMKLKVRSCTFAELIGHHQYAMIEIATLNEQTQKSESLHLRVRADEAMSFCLQASAKFFSTKDFMSRCRDLDVDLTKLESNLVEGALPALQAEIEISSKKHPYVM